MKYLTSLVLVLAAIGFSSCDKAKQIDRVLDATESIPTKMDTLGSSTNELKRLSIMDAEEKKLLNTANYDITAPVQFKLLAPAKLIGENFTADEAVKWIGTQIKEINKTQVGDRFADSTSAAAVKWQDDKFGAVLMLTTVSGLLPDTLVAQIVQKIQHDDDMRPEMFAILSMRAYFLQHVILAEAYASAELKSLGAVEMAINYNKSLENILRLPFAAYIETNIYSFSSDYLAETDAKGNVVTLNDKLTYGVDPMAAKKGWSTIAYGLDHFVKINQFSANQAQAADQAARQAAALAAVNAGIAAWASVVP